MGSVTEKEIAKARKELDKIRANPELMERIRLQEAYEMDYNTPVDWAKNEGKEAGIAEGQKEKQLEIAKNMLLKDIDIKTISEVTGLSPDEIEKLTD